jgi:chemotaxis protein CheZ
MIRKQKHGESGDSEDLQALFDQFATNKADEIRATPVTSAPPEPGGDSNDLQALFDELVSGKPEPEPEAAPIGPAPLQGLDDSDELQALFDSVASAGEASSACGIRTAPGLEDSENEEEHVFKRVGMMTRQVHDALRTLLGDASLKDAVEAIPDARQRLNYIALMTEQAASRVLNATDIARPLQTQLESEAERLRGEWDRVFANQVSVDDFRTLALETHRFLGNTEESSRVTSAQLLEIMMAQDFQDLTGQVIKRVVDLAQTLERELLSLLIEITPPERMPARSQGLMNGPVIDSRGRDDVVTSQEQVDDLLDSLGF